jgi:uncharacterized membrane protein
MTMILRLATFAAAASTAAAQPGLSTVANTSNLGYASTISGDGSTILGILGGNLTCGQLAGEPDGFYWTLKTGVRRLYDWPASWECRAYSESITDDGEVAVGWSSDGSSDRAIRWTAQTGPVMLWEGPLGKAAAWALTPDGSVVVGNSGSQAVRWTAAGVIPLPAPDHVRAEATGVSADGRTIVGYAVTATGRADAVLWVDSALPTPIHVLAHNAPSYARWRLRISRDARVVAGGQEPAFRWTAAQGAALLPPLAGATSAWVNSISPDGTLILGSCYGPSSGDEACIWTDGPQVQSLRGYLVGRGVNVPPGARLTAAHGISIDGNIIVGRGTVPGHPGAAFRAQLRPCYADCDGSLAYPALNVSDYICFLNRYAAGLSLTGPAQVHSYANCDGSTAFPVLSVSDFTCFANFFASGCP